MPDTPLDFRPATAADAALLIALMRAFYAEDRIEFDEARVRRGIDALLADPANGEALLWLDEDGNVAGYAIVTACFSIEQGGRYALLDELYLAPSARGRGWGRQSLSLLERRAADRGARRMRLEVNRHNAAARGLYLRLGYRDEARDLLTLALPAARQGVAA
ncbi:GNAT family N-acetyltransferase [Luteimonas aquatica]|uniref:GNAT family N-acetyltransferase n=1 Tax=Luteimonas aquatica TaxID=450364 RepID=UPI001F577CF3|nr:GNAT family N-acetyltransferase [Luteimonas aquatica]